jgi:integrase
MKPFKHATGRWAVQFSAKASGIGKRQMRYYDSERDALADIRKWTRQRDEFGRSAVTSEERDWIIFARRQLGKLDLLPEVISHWKATGSGSITPTLVADAVAQFKDWRLPRLKERTRSDIRWRLDAFAEAFSGQYMHQLHAGDLETWIYAQGKPWSVRSFYKRLRPLFDYGMRHRMLAENPMLLLKAPEVPSDSKAVYTGEQLNRLLRECMAPSNLPTILEADFRARLYHLLPFICLTAFGWMRTSELVRQYANEDVLTWEDIDWKNSRIHIRESVGKATRRKSGNERFVPMTAHLKKWLQPFAKLLTGRVVPLLHREFATQMRKLHADAGIKLIHNGLRRSAISHYLAAHPETGIGELARRAGTSEATVKRHYLEALTPEAGRKWFTLKPLAQVIEETVARSPLAPNGARHA